MPGAITPRAIMRTPAREGQRRRHEGQRGVTGAPHHPCIISHGHDRRGTWDKDDIPRFSLALVERKRPPAASPCLAALFLCLGALAATPRYSFAGLRLFRLRPSLFLSANEPHYCTAMHFEPSPADRLSGLAACLVALARKVQTSGATNSKNLFLARGTT